MYPPYRGYGIKGGREKTESYTLVCVRDTNYQQGGEDMPVKWIRAWGILTVVFLVAPVVVLAQGDRRGDRAEIQITNDWENTVRVTLWKE